MTETFRIQSGIEAKATAPIYFTFDGKRYQGYPGDTLASALIANGVAIVGRSFKYHRPRGIYSDGLEEPSALVQLETGANTVPNIQATQIELYDGLIANSQNCWPNLRYDIKSLFQWISVLLLAGFYNKTFMWPQRFWMYYEHWIRKAAGMGRSPREPDPDLYDQVNSHADILIIGAGPAGLMAAVTAARSGCSVTLVENMPWLGGRCSGNKNTIAETEAKIWLNKIQEELSGLDNVTLFTRTTAFGVFENNLVYCVERVTDHLPVSQRSKQARQRLWRVRAKEIILATGAIERPLVFKNNDRPGVMLASSVKSYVNHFNVLPGKRTIIFTNNDSAYDLIDALLEAGAQIPVIIDTREKIPAYLKTKAHELNIKVLSNAAITDVKGKNKLSGIKVRHLKKESSALDGEIQQFTCDLLACSGGWSPTVHLYSQNGGVLHYDRNIASYVPDSEYTGLHCIGAVAGIFDLKKCLQNSVATTTKVLEKICVDIDAPPNVSVTEKTNTAYNPGPLIMPVEKEADKRKQFIDLQNDVTVADIGLAVREGYESVEHLKRYTTTGMGTDQGKTSNINALELLSGLSNYELEKISTTTFRPPFTPVTFGVFAGQRRDSFIVPVRNMPIQSQHEALGAIFENVGRWRRPVAYPRNGESTELASLREARCVRQHVGVMEVSPFGKIEVTGPDAVSFLNRVYTNSFDSLKVGHCRYGVILNEYGTIFEDGLVMRLAEDHYLMSTTSGNAESMVPWLEYWLQCEWPELQVYLTDVAEQWAQIVVAGPRSRNLLTRIVDIDISNEGFPHLSLRQTSLGNIPARIYRVSFTGDLAYEIAVPASRGGEVWEKLMAAGADLNIAPYGLVASNILRMEKGYILVGEDTEGIQTPEDMGLGWVVSRKKKEAFIGQRSMSLPEYTRDGRKKYVGLLTDDGSTIPTIGAPVVEVHEKDKVIGHITSSQYSVAMGRSMALALIENGHRRMSDSVTIDIGNQLVPAKITQTCFFDPEGEKLNA